jgi:hypothetical protein
MFSDEYSIGAIPTWGSDIPTVQFKSAMKFDVTPPGARSKIYEYRSIVFNLPAVDLNTGKAFADMSLSELQASYNWVAAQVLKEPKESESFFWWVAYRNYIAQLIYYMQQKLKPAEKAWYDYPLEYYLEQKQKDIEKAYADALYIKNLQLARGANPQAVEINYQQNIKTKLWNIENNYNYLIAKWKAYHGVK